MLHADALNSLLVLARAVERLEQFCGEMSTRCKLGHAADTFGGGDGHNSCNDGDVDPGQTAAVTEIKKVMVVKKELGADIVGTLVHLGLEVIHFKQAVGSVRVSLWKGSHANSKSACVRVLA